MSHDSQQSFRVTAPGRVCLFGEHSDYFGLDVITAAIDLSIEIIANPREDERICVTYLDLNESDEFPSGSEIPYRVRRDYIRSAFNVMARAGMQPKTGWDLQVSGTIPIAAGLSSSSALAVATIQTIAGIAGENLTSQEIALKAFEAEVSEFGESGGTMDHFAIAFGNVIHVNTVENKVTRLPAEVDRLVIGDSREKKKDTVGDIRYIKNTVEAEYEKISRQIESFDRRTTPIDRVYELSKTEPIRERRMAEATLHNRDLTSRAFKLLSTSAPDRRKFGKMLREHHELMRDDLERSTPKIEAMIDAAYDAGALGCKINGSGGGGSMMAYAVDCEQEVAAAIERAGGTAYIVRVVGGVSMATDG